ncbi:MAG: hypothetical protein WDA08_03315 [Weeksellaceae bacterium]
MKILYRRRANKYLINFSKAIELPDYGSGLTKRHNMKKLISFSLMIFGFGLATFATSTPAKAQVFETCLGGKNTCMEHSSGVYIKITFPTPGE